MAIEKAKEQDYIKKGDLVVITAGVPIGVTGATNLMKVQIVGEILLRGLGLGRKAVTAKACVIRSLEDAKDKFKPGDIIVSQVTDRDLMPYIEQASGMIIEEGGYTSHGAIVALNLEIPTVVGAKDATIKIEDGCEITLDSNKGIIYEGRTRVF
jgi:pyruvate kinase